MSVEERLGAFRLCAPAEGPRRAVLRAVAWARGEQLLWRWTWAAAAATLAVCVPVNVAIQGRVASAPNARVEQAVEEISKSLKDENFRRRLWLALSPPKGAKETLP